MGLERMNGSAVARANSALPGNGRINLITMHMNGHARHSGYDRLTAFLDGTIVSGPERFSLPQRVVARLLRPLTRRSGLLWYHRSNLIAELHAALRWLQTSRGVFHFLYGENSYRYLGVMKRLWGKNALVATFHTPPEKFLQVVDDPSHLKSLDAIVVMSTMQMQFFADIVGAERVFFVPHGVDTDYYCPAEGEERGEILRCLLVGSHLRDFETFAAAAKRISGMDGRIEFTVITPESNHSFFSGLGNVSLHSRVSDETLLEMYQKADLFILPLLECTANNVLLEAMACGLPVVATDLQGVRDYVDGECAILVPKMDVDALVAAILELRGDSQRRNAMCRAARSRALDFGWENIAQQLSGVYEKTGCWR